MGTQRAPTVDATRPYLSSVSHLASKTTQPRTVPPLTERRPYGGTFDETMSLSRGVNTKASSRGAAKTQIQMCFRVLSHSKVHGVINYDIFILGWSTMGCLAYS